MVILLGAPGLLACQGTTLAPAKSATVAPDSVAPNISEEEFPQAAHQAFLTTDRSAEEKLRLAGIVQHQLTRARTLFVQGHEKAAEDATVGALLLLRQDDALEVALRGQEEVLLLAAHTAARRGDSGRAAAFYERLLRLHPDPKTKADVEGHLAAMASFRQATAGSSALMRAGEEVRHTLSLATVEPSQQAYQTAQKATLAWMKVALESPALSKNPESIKDREEALEAYQAIRSGTPALMSLCLRQGDPLEVLELLSEAHLDRALPGGARGLLTEAGRSNDPEAWLNLFRLLDGARRNESGESNLPAYLADAGALWSALSLYRAGPGELKYAMPLSMMLLELGMPEVATTLLSQTVGPDTTGEALAWSLSLALRAMLELGRTDQIEAARVSFKEAHKLLTLARSKLPDDAESASSLHLMLANLEIRFGNTSRALPLLTEASSQSARASTWLRLAEVTYQVKGAQEAIAALKRAIMAAQVQGDVLTEARASELLFSIERDTGKNTNAAHALEIALRRALTARAMDLPQVPVASVERVLGRVLESYGNQRATRRAYARALDASRRNAAEVSFTLTEMARSALTTGDMRLAREATQEALDLNIETADLIYIALWQSLLEQRTKSRPDALPRTALAAALDAHGWAGQLRLFGLGELSGAQLIATAKSPVERVEAEFYAAMADRDPAAQRSALEKVAKSPAIDLIEVRIARDVIAPRTELPWPEGVELP